MACVRGDIVIREMSAAGKIYLQDEASQLVAEMMDVQHGDRVLDLCAAPGGKTTLMADRAGNHAVIVAADRSATRMATVVATTLLHGLNIWPVILDATEQLPFERESFDRVLVDAPCSGTGRCEAILRSDGDSRREILKVLRSSSSGS